MGRYKKYRPSRFIQMPLASGGTLDFYEPDQLLSENLNSKKMLGMEIAIRETAWDYYRVLGFLPNPSETLRKLNKDINEYKYLLEDSHVNGCMESRMAGTLSQEWTLDRNDCATRQYQTIKAILDGWPINDIMHEILYAVFFGYQPVEVIWNKVGGQLLPKELVPKDPNWFRFSDINEIRYLTKRNMVTGEPIPNYKFIMPRYRPSYERPYGRPLGSAVYWPVKFRHSGLRFWTNFAEKYGTPWLNIRYPLGTQQARIAEMMSMVDTCVQDGIIATPTEFTVEALKMNDGSSSDIYKDFIEEMNREISIAILGQTLTTSMDKSGGSFAAAKVHATVRDDIAVEDKKLVEMVFNTLISWIYELNWKGSEARPKFKLVQALVPTKDDAQAAVYLKQSGVTFTKEYYQNRFGLTETEFDLAPVMVAGPGQDGTPPDMDGDTAQLTHESTDLATNQPTYDSTKDAFNNLTRR